MWASDKGRTFDDPWVLTCGVGVDADEVEQFPATTWVHDDPPLPICIYYNPHCEFFWVRDEVGNLWVCTDRLYREDEAEGRVPCWGCWRSVREEFLPDDGLWALIYVHRSPLGGDGYVDAVSTDYQIPIDNCAISKGECTSFRIDAVDFFGVVKGAWGAWGGS